MQVLAIAREIPGPVPLPDVLHRCACSNVPFVDRGLAHRIVQVTDILAGTHTESDRRVGGAEGRDPDLRNRFTQAFGDHRHPVDIAQLALVGSETQSRVALDVLYITVTLSHGESNVCDAGVVLEIQKLLRAALRLRVGGHAPKRMQRVVVPVRRGWQFDVRYVETAA